MTWLGLTWSDLTYEFSRSLMSKHKSMYRIIISHASIDFLHKAFIFRVYLINCLFVYIYIDIVGESWVCEDWNKYINKNKQKHYFLLKNNHSNSILNHRINIFYINNNKYSSVWVGQPRLRIVDNPICQPVCPLRLTNRYVTRCCLIV